MGARDDNGDWRVNNYSLLEAMSHVSLRLTQNFFPEPQQPQGVNREVSISTILPRILFRRFISCETTAPVVLANSITVCVESRWSELAGTRNIEVELSPAVRGVRFYP